MKHEEIAELLLQAVRECMPEESRAADTVAEVTAELLEGDPTTNTIVRAVMLARNAGLRRAQELAKGLSFEAWGEELHILAPELYEAIDAEVAKEWK